ncbi:FliM/FliN family flagellar motor switch protein [Vibrio coralliirubri]|uniref:FliM/FliN family flagellar motor switch protein n=1 Tax=Vibrio coralliirubri TaxID=1516159 RepID=UPI002283AEC8|nr:FliM/FliN family flagellar motor switch protein [Vibrio coralliirubri]MCY9860984.1 FliM/FliN family flagellar motor switch protein [Vibrio coralliirubri]
MNKTNTINNVPVELSVRIGRAVMTFGEMQELTSGAIIELEANTTDGYELLANDQVIATGTLEDVDGKVKFTITEMA